RVLYQPYSQQHKESPKPAPTDVPWYASTFTHPVPANEMKDQNHALEGDEGSPLKPHNVYCSWR
ncbi:MAG: hypothetical protein RLP02_17080, partial [Coleofasciculus sp. C2-GNP5-27]